MRRKDRPRIAALCCVYQKDKWLSYSCKSIYKSVDAIYYFVNSMPWSGPVLNPTETVKIIESLDDPESKITLVQGAWKSQIEQRNFTIAQASFDGYDYGLINDSDEVYENRELTSMIDYAVSKPDVHVWLMHWFTYWKTTQFVISPVENYRPPMILKLGTCGFVETRNLGTSNYQTIPAEVGMCHHMSFARSDQEMLAKMKFFAPENILQGWFHNVWKRWDQDPKLENLHPVNPSQFKRAIEQNEELLPRALREYNQLNA